MVRFVQFSVIPSGIVLGRYGYIAVTGQLGHRARGPLRSAERLGQIHAERHVD